MAPPSEVSLELIEKMPNRLSKLVEPLELELELLDAVDRASSCEDLRGPSISIAALAGGGVVLVGAPPTLGAAIEVKVVAVVWVGW